MRGWRRKEESNSEPFYPCLPLHIFTASLSKMKSYLGLLAGLAIRVLADTCDPNAYEESNPYNLEETTDPKVTSKLLEYLADSACHMYSDGTEQDVKEQCKNVCIPGDSAGEGQVVVSSQSCIFGDNPWYGLTDTLHPLLCGAERAYNGTSFWA
jgi:hypothetical protein